MGNWSPYSEEWEQQRVQKALGQIAEDYTHKKAAFERLPRPIQALIKAGQTIHYYIDIAFIQIRKRIDRKHREKMEAGVAQLKGIVETAVKQESVRK